MRRPCEGLSRAYKDSSLSFSFSANGAAKRNETELAASLTVWSQYLSTSLYTRICLTIYLVFVCPCFFFKFQTKTN